MVVVVVDGQVTTVLLNLQKILLLPHQISHRIASERMEEFIIARLIHSIRCGGMIVLPKMMYKFMYLIVNGVGETQKAMVTATLVRVEILRMVNSTASILSALKSGYWDKKLRSFKI